MLTRVTGGCSYHPQPLSVFLKRGKEKVMREIKFRAWWIEKKIILHNVHDFYDQLGDYSRGNAEEPESSFGNILFKPDKYVVMQFTGLCDRNGKEIYEGDIVAMPFVGPMGKLIDYEDFHVAVIFEHGCFGYRRYDFHPLMNWCEKTDGAYVPNFGNLTIIGNSTVNVIGNIHEDPELLTVVKP
jgi:uncharacterized phage protein (TIGR01671 family)